MTRVNGKSLLPLGLNDFSSKGDVFLFAKVVFLVKMAGKKNISGVSIYFCFLKYSVICNSILQKLSYQ